MRRPNPLDVPFLPLLGQLFWAKTIMFQPADKKPERPVLVVRAPRDAGDRIAVVVRTSHVSQDGVEHPADPRLGLNKPGMFVHLKSTEAQLWTPRNARLCGDVDADVVRAVLARWVD